MPEHGSADSRFDIGDILFSRTGADGCIRVGNTPFQRMTFATWDDLFGASHDVLRHPSIPVGLSQMLWDRVSAGQPFGAYVCNRCAGDGFYWAFITVLPVGDSFISLRLKPGTALQGKVAAIYAARLASEQENGDTPEESAAALDMAIRDLGFTSYGEFMSKALFDETMSRDKALGRSQNTVLQNLADMYIQIRKMETLAGTVDGSFKQTNQIPYNMRLQAGRLEGSDGPISVISSNYRIMTQGLADNVARFTRDSAVGAEAAHLAVFKTAAADLLGEMSAIFAREALPAEIDQQAELDRLHRLGETYRRESLEDVTGLAIRVRKFGRHCADMRRMLSALELTRIMCKIERSKFPGERAGLDEIVNRLADAQKTLQTSFDAILKSVKRILASSDRVSHYSRAATARRKVA